MTSHRILITEEYFNAHFFCLLICLCVRCQSRYFVQIFVNPVERLNSPVYSVPPCRFSVLLQVLTYSGFYDSNLEFVSLDNVQIVASMNAGNSLGRHKLTSRFTSIVRLSSIGYAAVFELLISLSQFGRSFSYVYLL